MKAFALALALTSLPFPAFATNGHDLLVFCKQQRESCELYIKGFQKGLISADGVNNRNEFTSCYSIATDAGVDMLIGWLQGHPDQWGSSDPWLMHEGLCQKPSGPDAPLTLPPPNLR
jgi:hypothetical protein